MRLARPPAGCVEIALPLHRAPSSSCRRPRNQPLNHIIHIRPLPPWCRSLPLHLSSSLRRLSPTLSLQAILHRLPEVTHSLELHPLALGPHLHAVRLPLEVQLLGGERVQGKHRVQLAEDVVGEGMVFGVAVALEALGALIIIVCGVVLKKKYDCALHAVGRRVDASR